MIIEWERFVWSGKVLMGQVTWMRLIMPIILRIFLLSFSFFVIHFQPFAMYLRRKGVLHWNENVNMLA